MKYLAQCVGIVVLLLSLGLPMLTQAQDDGGLTEDQMALIERIAGIDESLATHTSYRSNRIDIQNNNLIINNQENKDNKNLQRFGYVVNEEGVENNTYTLNLDYEGLAHYSIRGEVREIDGIIYANVMYAEADEGVEPLPEGWLAIETADDIPYTMHELNLSQHFNDDEPLINDPELLATYATLVTVTEVTTTVEDEEVTLEQIMVVVGPENFPAFYFSILDEEAQQNSMLQAIFSEGLEGSMTVIAQFRANGDIYLLSASMDMEHRDINAYAASPDLFDEGDIMSFVAEYSILSSYTNFDEVFATIEIPDLVE